MDLLLSHIRIYYSSHTTATLHSIKEQQYHAKSLLIILLANHMLYLPSYIDSTYMKPASFATETDSQFY